MPTLLHQLLYRQGTMWSSCFESFKCTSLVVDIASYRAIRALTAIGWQAIKPRRQSPRNELQPSQWTFSAKGATPRLWQRPPLRGTLRLRLGRSPRSRPTRIKTRRAKAADAWLLVGTIQTRRRRCACYGCRYEGETFAQGWMEFFE